MTNTKFRKRALLSSVAMLLVALVALGSATFAWFTENPRVTATGIAAEAQTSTGLEIQTTTDQGFKDAALFMKEGTGLKLVPAYALQGESAITWLDTQAGTASLSAPKTGAVWASVTPYTAQDGQTTLSAAVYKESAEIRTKNGEDADIVLTNLTINLNQAAPAIKSGVTVLVAVNGVTKRVVKAGSAATLNYADAAATEAVKTASGTYPKETTNGVFSGSEALGPAGSGASGHPTLTVDVYVYLDGTDENVKTDNALAGALLDSINMTFEKA